MNRTRPSHSPIALATLTALALLPAAAGGSQVHWPAFRGDSARGVAEGSPLPTRWDLETGEGVLWRTAIPGLGHSSPIVWGDRVFLTTAVSEGEPELVLGDEGGIDLSSDLTRHSWWLYCLDKRSGEVLWKREAYAGEPRARRHVKASQANATPVTDGTTVVAIFGAQGIAAFDFAGNERWRADLGVLDPGLFGDPTSQWGHSSSPILFDDLVIVQVDRHRDSFLAALALATGETVWRVDRDEKPIWATPTLHRGPARTELIVAGGDYDRGYDPRTGRELWRFHRDLEVKTPTPIVADGLIVLSGGYRGKPLWALRVGIEGDVSLPEGADHSAAVAWKSDPGGPYTSTPLAYDGLLYFVRNTGIFNVLDLAGGERLHQERLDSTFSASPVAGDGKVYLTGEQGVVTVVAAGRAPQVLARNDMGEPAMATPAISEGVLFIRTRSRIVAVGGAGGGPAGGG